MLMKLFKYDIKYLMRNISVFYLFTIISAVIYALIHSIKNSFTIFAIIEPLFAVFLFILLLGTILYSFYLGIKRFYQNTLKDEGYLTNTLPVKKSTIVLARLLANTLTMICTTAVCIIIAFLIDYESFDLSSLGNEVVPGLNGYAFLIIIIFILISQFATYATSFYSALSLGNKHNSNKIIWSIIYGIGIYIAMQTISIITIVIYALLMSSGNADFAVYLTESGTSQSTIILQLLTIAFTLNIIYTVINFFITTYTLKNKLNLE
ncbi:MAG: hypothetical protein ACK5LC_05980 [Coprobacillaceae bacterium]